MIVPAGKLFFLPRGTIIRATNICAHTSAILEHFQRELARWRNRTWYQPWCIYATLEMRTSLPSQGDEQAADSDKTQFGGRREAKWVPQGVDHMPEVEEHLSNTTQPNKIFERSYRKCLDKGLIRRRVCWTTGIYGPRVKTANRGSSGYIYTASANSRSFLKHRRNCGVPDPTPLWWS